MRPQKVAKGTKSRAGTRFLFCESLRLFAAIPTADCASSTPRRCGKKYCVSARDLAPRRRVRLSGLYPTIRRVILSSAGQASLEFLRRFRAGQATKRTPNVASARVFAATRFCKSQPANDLRGGRKTRPDKTRKTTSPSTICRTSSLERPTNRT